MTDAQRVFWVLAALSALGTGTGTLVTLMLNDSRPRYAMDLLPYWPVWAIGGVLTVVFLVMAFK